jgi:crossover junction endodeoxyribonuclease RuvC
MIIIGIDPGITGAVAAIDHHGMQAVEDMPFMEKSSSKGKATVRNQINAAALADLLRRLTIDYETNAIMVFIERVGSMQGQGVATMFSIGHSCGMIEGVVAALRLPHRLITPGEWKKAMKLPRGGDKNEARALAQRLYPQAPLQLVKHHNRAEAILIARYGYEVQA